MLWVTLKAAFLSIGEKAKAEVDNTVNQIYMYMLVNRNAFLVCIMLNVFCKIVKFCNVKSHFQFILIVEVTTIIDLYFSDMQENGSALILIYQFASVQKYYFCCFFQMWIVKLEVVIFRIVRMLSRIVRANSNSMTK